ncbi:MAG: outer membrane beta-barrel protein, partial [Leeuwenhoekiella sp.]
VDFLYGSSITNWWYLNFVTSFFYSKIHFPTLEIENQYLDNDVYANYSVLGNYFTLSKDGTFTGELSAYFLNDYVMGTYTWDRPQSSVSLGLRKTFFNERLSATVNVEDIFNTLNMPVSAKYLNQDNGFFAKSENRYVRFGVKYNFGNFKLSDNERSTDAEESERLKKKEFMPHP